MAKRMSPKTQDEARLKAQKDTTVEQPIERQGGKRVIHGSWGGLKLRFSERHKDFDESRDS